jgi:hypothetical protein
MEYTHTAGPVVVPQFMAPMGNILVTERILGILLVHVSDAAGLPLDGKLEPVLAAAVAVRRLRRRPLAALGVYLGR